MLVCGIRLSFVMIDVKGYYKLLVKSICCIEVLTISSVSGWYYFQLNPIHNKWNL